MAQEGQIDVMIQQCCTQPGAYPHPTGHGFTLVELLVVVAIVAALAMIAYPAYHQYIDKANIAQAKVDINSIEQAIQRFYTVEQRYPDTLNDIGMAAFKDPWGNNYEYTNIASGNNHIGDYRKDRFLHPLNTDYDLYSMGKDGASAKPLTAGISQDDIVRANNGAFVDLASNY